MITKISFTTYLCIFVYLVTSHCQNQAKIDISPTLSYIDKINIYFHGNLNTTSLKDNMET